MSASGRPALSSGTMPQRPSSAVTRRASVRSGVTRAARVAGLRRLAQAERDGERLGALVGRLDPGEARRRRRRACPASAAPSLRHWSVTGAGRSASETRAFRSGAGGAAGSQAGTAAGSNPSASARRAEAVLRVVRRAGVVRAEALPDRGRQTGVEAWQHQRALRQPRDRGHEGAGRRRASRWSPRR